MNLIEFVQVGTMARNWIEECGEAAGVRAFLPLWQAEVILRVDRGPLCESTGAPCANQSANRGGMCESNDLCERGVECLTSGIRRVRGGRGRPRVPAPLKKTHQDKLRTGSRPSTTRFFYQISRKTQLACGPAGFLLFSPVQSFRGA